MQISTVSTYQHYMYDYNIFQICISELKGMVRDNKEFVFHSRYFSMVSAEVKRCKKTKRIKVSTIPHQYEHFQKQGNNQTNNILFQVSLNPWKKEEKFNIDGQYVPRIFVLDTNGEVLKEFDNELGNTKFSYFYPRDDQCKFANTITLTTENSPYRQ